MMMMMMMTTTTTNGEHCWRRKFDMYGNDKGQVDKSEGCDGEEGSHKMSRGNLLESGEVRDRGSR
jgi:hypothetical protein